ncbi:ATP-binding protein [Chitinispirillales bacterium ANBcel5]|uniref:two-component system sensor histidine kinase NtrB n=1 Tax=Cellulosispirillum alkaliphilum TaxID=3039283 RepID=UPI002A5526E5|nr:ATP-binding protein [Chitinispirillales bacterium ANBcel5]
MMEVKDAFSVDVYRDLHRAFVEFQNRAEKLSTAYEAMQQDFKNVNIELDRKNAQLAGSLAQKEEVQTYLNSILESMDNGVIGVNTAGEITHFNKAAGIITGYNAEKVMGRPYTEIFITQESRGSTLLKTLQSGCELLRDERVLWHKDGHPVPVSYQTAILKDGNGRKLGAVEIFSDISRLKAMEREMQQNRTMAALGEMSATVAHEIRNPLGAMGVWAGLLERDLEPKDSRRKTLNKITEGLSRLNKIVSNLLVYTRPVTTEFRKLELGALLEEIVDFTEIEIERLGVNIKVDKKLKDAENLFVLADPEKMSQAIMNVCLNAVQAMNDGGTLAVSFEKGKKERGFSAFTISDTGCGMESEVLEKIFDPFFTTKENGTGLGLAIVKKIVESHSGHIDVNSSSGNGTSVKIFLPYLKD